MSTISLTFNSSIDEPNMHAIINVLQTTKLGYTQPRELLLPAIERLLRNARLPNDRFDRCARFMLPLAKRDLLFRKSLPFHGSSSLRSKCKITKNLAFRSGQETG
jgi:hypothetical protein